ncbi:DMT family transporter [Qipengyuania sp.]|uniref:DMT family transporter n=1 Tax=Qipengyuania sp. TaxID=2004515 RepID=UPI0035C83EC5
MDGTIAQPRPFLALGLRLAAAGALATMMMLVKLAGTHDVHLLEMLFWRQALTFPLILAIMFAAKRLHELKTERPGAHVRRSVYGITGMVFVYGSVLLLPLAEQATISFTAPLFAVLLSAFLFGEKVGVYRWSAVALGFAGIVIVMRPGGDISMVNPLGVFVGLVAAFLVALISYQIQDLNRTESPWAIVAWFTGLTAPVMALALPFVGKAHDLRTWGIIGAMSLAGATGQILLTSSLRYGHAATIIVMDYTALLWATFYGWQVFGRLPPATLAFGAPLILAAGLVIAWRERSLARRAASGTGEAPTG